MAFKKNEEYDWIDDAFDDKKNEEAYLEAQKANSRGCLIALAIGAFVMIAIAIATFSITSTLLAS